MYKYIILLLFLLVSCKSSEKTTEKKEVKSLNELAKSKVITTQLPSINSYLIDLDDLKASKTITTPTGTDISIKKDITSNKLKITYETKYDTIYVNREINNKIIDTIIDYRIKNKEIYVPNPLNWQLPVILGVIIIVLILIIKYF